MFAVDGQDHKRYALRTDRSYLLTVYQRAYTDRPRGDSSVSPRTLTLDADAEAVRLIERSSPITGKYAGHRFRFKTETLRRHIDSALRLEIHRVDDRRVPPIYVPLRVQTPLWRHLLRLASVPLFILGVVGLFLSDQWFPGNPSLTMGLSILVMILTGEHARNLIYNAIGRLGTVASSR